jgi:hypothetical protein
LELTGSQQFFGLMKLGSDFLRRMTPSYDHHRSSACGLDRPYGHEPTREVAMAKFKAASLATRKAQRTLPARSWPARQT